MSSSEILSFQQAVKEVISSQETKEEKYLAVASNKNGYHFSAVVLTRWDRFKRMFGFGSTCPKKIAEGLLANCKSISQWADSLSKDRSLVEKELIPAQKLLDSIFKQAGAFSPFHLYEKTHASWMGNLSEEVQKKCIFDLVLPGTHDSAAYQIDFQHSLKRYHKLTRWIQFFPFVGKIISGWSRTQDKNLYDQLKSGIRFLDFRISYHEQEEKFYLTHTFTCVSLEQALADIRRFVDEHPTEVVLILARSDYENKKGMQDLEREQQMVKVVQEELCNRLCPPTKSKEEMTLEALAAERHQVLFYYESRKDHEADLKEVWSGKKCKEYWANSFEPQNVVQKLKQEIEKTKSKAKDLRIESLVLTPEPKDIVTSVLKKLFLPWKGFQNLQYFAEKFNQTALDKMDVSVHRKVNVLTEDFVSPEFVQRVISMNHLEAEKAISEHKISLGN